MRIGMRQIRFGAAFVIVTMAVFCARAAELGEVFEKTVKPILNRHCFECHGEKKQKGGVDFHEISTAGWETADPDFWNEVRELVIAYEMPPEGSNEMGVGVRNKLVGWIEDIPKPDLDCDQLASDRTQRFYRGHAMSRRLNRHEYENAVRDLFGMEFDVAKMLPSDGAGGEGFDNVGDTLFTTSLSIEKYLAAAEQIVATLFPEEPDGHTMETLEARARLLDVQPDNAESPREIAGRVIAKFARLAFRRPVTEGEVEKYLAMYDRATGRGDRLELGLRLALKAVLISPDFLFIIEPEPDDHGTLPLDPIPLATRLSFFLWASGPDDELLTLAESGALSDDDVYRKQVRRMLADPKAAAFAERFFLQWLQLEGIGSVHRPDESRYPEFDDDLSASMNGEIVAFVQHLIREDRPLTELIASDYTFVNERLAKLYGIDGVEGGGFQRVSVDPARRGGIMGMAGVHLTTSYPHRTSPVLRGKWILESLLGGDIPPPPPDVPALEVEESTASAANVREKLELHRKNPDCAACHNRMDPLGFGLENFDSLGRWRDTEGGMAVDATGRLPSGETFTGPAELKRVLLARKQEIFKHLTRKMVGYALGRRLNKFDRCVIDECMNQLQAHEYRPSVWIETIATSFPFRHRFYPKNES